MKKMMKSLMAAIGVALTITGSVFAADVATIGDVEALKAFAVAVNGGKSYEGDTVTLSADLDLTGVEWTPIGVGTRSSKSYTGKAFKGTFDGGNHTISGLTITSTDSDDAAVGLFGVVDGGTVKNLKLDAVNINVASSDLAGGAIGLMVNNAKAENITVGGSIVGNDGVGGIAGRLIISGTISSCTNNASVTSSYGGIGGIVGKAYYEDGANTALFASVDKCVNNGTITAPMYVGGIVGLARANVTGCINNGVVVGGTQTGGIVGQLIAAGTVSNNENNAKISGKNHLGGIIGDYSQTPAYTYYNVTIANNINRGELAATEQCAAILGCNNIDGFTAMTASGNVSFYNAEGLELFGNPEDMVIDSTNMFNPAMTLSDFVQKVVAGNGVFDGNGATVQITPVSGDARTETKEGLPDRLQKYTNPEVYYAQYQRFGNLTDVSISNVKFVFVPAPVTVVDAWNTAGATTTADNINGELQLLNAGNVTFINCSFEKISVSPINATAVSVSGCSFNGLDAYAIKDIKASTVTVADTTFADCNGGFWMNAAPAVLSVIGNTFANVGRRGAIQFSANGDYSSTEMTVTGNNVTGGAFLWQLNPTVTYEQVSAILDTAKNTYGTAYVSGSTEPKPPVARIGDVTYATLEAAFAAATEGQTITLLQDATPALTSQRAITKAAVIDLGGKTLTLTEDDLYFGTTTFQNGNIVVDSSVKPSTAVFWMFANQTLTFDNVKVVATGVTGTYLIGLDGNNSDLNLLNGSEILVENTTALDLDIICVNASTGNDIVIDNSKINVTNLDGRVLFRGNYTIKGNSEINLEGITKAGIRIEAGQTLSIEDTASVTITGEPRDGGIHLTDVTATYTKADTATVSATVNRPAIAKIGDTPYYTLADAVAAAQASDEIVLLADATVEGTLALPAGIKLTSNGKTINGSIRMLGDLELNGPLTITGGLWVGKSGETLTATLSGDKLTASYFVFQRGTYTIDADIDAVYGYLSFEATFEVNSTIHTTGSNGEVLYINGNVTLNDGAVLDSDNSVFVCNDNAVLTLKPGSTVDSNVKITTSGAKVNVDATGMTAGATANITGTVTNSGNGTVAIVNSDMFVAQIVNGKIVLVGYVAKIGEQKYTSLQSAIEAVQNGETVTLLADVDVTTPAYVQNALNHARNVNFTLDLNGKTLTANTGNSVFRFNIANSGATSDVAITIKNGKVVAGASTWCALMASGISADVKAVMNLEDLTVEASKAGDLAIKAWANGVVNASNVTVNATNAAGGFYAVGGEIVLNDCTVNQKGLHTAPYLSMAFAVSDSGKMTVNSGTYSAEPTAAAEGYNQGTTHGSWVGGVMNSGGTLIINGGTFSNGNFGEDSLATAARGLIFGDTASNIRINGGTFNALKSVIDYQNNLGVQPNPNIVIAGGTFSADPTVVTSYGGVEIAEGYVVTKNNGVWTVAKAVAKIGAGYYTNLVDAFKAATEGCTIEILSDVTIDYKWDCRDYATGGSHSQFKESVTINGNGHTLKFTGTVNDSNWNTIFRFEENATVNNLTVDISEATGAQRVISAKKSLTVDGLTVVGSAKYGIIFGEGASAADLAAAEIVVKNSTLTGTRRAISDNEGGKDVKSVAITDNTLNANVYASASESITFNNNTAAGEVDLRSYTAENVLSVEAKGNTLNAGVKNYIYAKNIDAQEGFTAERVPTTVSTYEQLIAALAEDNAYVVLANDITATATQSSGYGKAGIVVEAGDVLDGNDKTLTINGANATWDCAIAMRGGEVKNLTIAGAMRGVFMPGANSDVVIDNCKFQDVIYTFNSDDGSKDYTVTIKNTELNGWTSFSDVHKAVVFDTCTFAKGNGYAYCRPYQATTFKDCSFSGDFEIDCSRVADNKLAFNGCTYNGQAITSENAFDLFGDGAKVLVNGAPADYTKVAQVGDNYYTSINAALAAAQDGDTVYVFAGDYTQDLVIDKDITVIGETTDTGYQLAAIWGQLQITADGATVKGFYVYDGDTAAYVNAKDVLIEGCELVGAGWAGLYQSYTDGTVTFKDSTIVGATYGIHFDGSDGGNIIIDNCKIQGWTSFASTINNVAISNSEFAEGYYNQLRFYQNAQLTNVTFNENMTIDFGKDDVDASFSGCSVENGGSLLDVIYLDDIHNMGVDVTIDDAPVVLVAKIGDKYYTTLQEAFDAAVAGTGNVTVEILSDIDLTGTDWNPVTVSAPGYPFVTVNGNNKTITGLNDMLFAGTWAGKSGLVINDLTIADSTIVNDENDSKGNVGVGAFIGYPQASATVTLNNCHLKDSTVKGGHWTGGLVGIAGGYNGTDGPVFMTLTIDGCSVTGSTITGKGSAGGIIGHGSCSAWTDVIIVNSTVSNNTITSTGSSTNKAGSVMGTIGAAGQPTTVNGVEKTGGMSVSVTTAGNTVKSADKVITTIYGRQDTETGLLEIAGGTYEAYPIEENVEYAAPKDGYIIFENADGKYGVKEGTYVAQINGVKYENLASALAAAQNDAVVELLWAEGNAPIAMNGSVYGKSVTITGTATVDWSKGFLFVGRGGEGNGTVIFDNANLASASNNASTGIHVSGREKNTNNKYDGTVVINNSTIVLDYLIDKGAMTMTNSTLTVKNGFAVGGRPASETESGVDATATFDLTNGSTLIVNNHNGMGLGYEAIGVMTIDSTSTFECTQSFLVTGKGALNVAKGGKVEFTGAVKTLTVNGALASAGDVSADIVAGENADIEISGGVYTQDVNEWCIEGCAALPNLNDEYVVGVKPTATVNNLGAMTIPANEYYIYNGSLTTGTEPMPLNFVMQFVADQKAEDMAESPFAQWFADFVITFEGIEGDSFDPSGCYLAGYYGSTDSWDGLWVKIPVDGLLTKVDEGVRYPVMLGVGMGQTYDYICSGVQAFSCAMYIPDDILAANPNLKVKLELNVVDSSKGADSAANALVAGENIFKASETEYTAEDFIDVELPEVEVVDIKNTLKDSDPDLTFALNFKIKDMENLTDEYLEKLFNKYGDYYTDYVLTISGLSQESVTFNANGGADGYLAGQYDAWSKNWVSVPFDDVTVENGQSLYIMEYAAKLMGQQGLRFTLAEVAEIVQNFDCGVYFTPEFLAANPDLKVDLELKVFTEDAEGNKVDDISVATNTFDKDDFGVAAVVAEGKQTRYFASLAEAISAAQTGDTVELLANVDLDASTIKISVGKDIALDLNGKEISGVCNTGSGSLIAVPNTAKLTVKDSSNPSTGKITYAAGTSNIGWTIYNEGNLVLESGTIELTGSWSIGYAVDLRPNAWGVGYANASVFELKGGNIVSSDGGVRIASTSHEGYANVAASFVMNGGKIDAAWDGVFIQQSNSVYDMLSFTMNGGTIESDLNPIRVYGPAPTEYVAGKNSINIALNGGTCTYTSEEARDGWVIPNVLRVGGGNSADIIIDNGGVVVSESFKVTNPVVGYTWVGIANNKYILARVNCKIAIKIIDNEPYIGLGINTTVCPVVALKAATNLENPEWDDVTYEAADDDADEYFWIKPTLNGNAYRFFKLAE